jgi:hypothetical protein
LTGYCYSAGETPCRSTLDTAIRAPGADLVGEKTPQTDFLRGRLEPGGVDCGSAAWNLVIDSLHKVMPHQFQMRQQDMIVRRAPQLLNHLVKLAQRSLIAVSVP